ncbi:cobyric acid synthase [Gordonia hydrophobica]|uniref:Cobyric acid synthase n=1 Tax=Gordonia hydrophobica TaxID=40516 RepID=A0ABZ2UBH9_9ACTN|nr:cobyric acid synthase [Gordonia hydrophobica]MBM7366145.1 adenosylcobyric acid synthase [Gordonia hydrophobica]
MAALLIAGTTSDAGKSVVTTGLCRAFARRGLRVAPYKAQNMSNNSMVVPLQADESGTHEFGEIGRAQWSQALAARAVPEVAMNPVLLKPGGDRRSHVVRMGRPDGEVSSRDFVDGRRHLAATAFAAFDDLVSRYDIVLAEGAGSPAEINLRAGDYVNMGLAQHGDVPTVVVGDIDRGGWFAASYGTLTLLDDADQRLVKGFIANKFRGDVSLLQPGLDDLQQRTSRPTFGVLPWHPDLWLDSEDALDLEGRRTRSDGAKVVAVVRLPRISNLTDVDALGLEPELDVRFVTDAARIAEADLVVLPGTRATLADLQWMRNRGLDRAVIAHARSGRPVLGICGGCQMLGQTIADPDGTEGDAGARVAGLGLLDVDTVFGADKTLRLNHPAGYEIHHGTVAARDGSTRRDGWIDGSVDAVVGTMVHGALEDDDLRAAYLAAALGIGSTASFPAARERRLDLLGDLVEDHLDVEALLQIAGVA